MTAYWEREFELNGKTFTFGGYVESVYQDLTDKQIAANLRSFSGEPCTANKVRKRRKRRGLMKEQKNGYQEEDKAPNEDLGLGKIEEPNLMIVYAKGADIKTLPELLEAGQVDTDVWEVEKWILNKWPIGAKAKEVNLSWENGKIQEGNIEEHGLLIAAMWQVKAWLVRKEPIFLFPAVQQVTCAPVGKPVAIKPTKGLKRTLVFADPHFAFYNDCGEMIPLHDRRALDLVLQIAIAAGVDRVDILGDYLDLADWSNHFIQSPEFAECTQEAVKEGHWWLSELRRAVPDAEIRLHEGNHGKRMRVALGENMRAAYGLRAADELQLPPALSIPRLLALHNLGIEWIGDYPQDDDWLNDKLCLSHGTYSNTGAGDTTKNVVSNSDTCQVFGHCHRQELASRTLYLRGGIEVIQAYTPGCVCWIDGRVPSKNKKLQWQNGMALIDYDDTGYYSIHSILIDKDRAVYNRQLFEARDRLEEIKAAFS